MAQVVSIIVPIYNMENYLDKTISSILNQTYKELDIVLVNDGSTDNSLNICQKYSKLDSRIRIFSKENGGLNSAVCYGVEKSIGDLIAFVDADDNVGKNFIFNFMNIYDGEDIVAMGFNYDNGVQLIPFMLKDNLIMNSKQDILKLANDFLMDNTFNLSNILFISRWNKIYKTKFLTEIIQMNKQFSYLSYGEDSVFTYLCLQNASEIRICSKANEYNYNISNQNSMTARIKNDIDFIKDCQKLEEAKRCLIHLNYSDQIIYDLIYFLGVLYINRYKRFSFIKFYNLTKKIVLNPSFQNCLRTLKKGNFKAKLKSYLLKSKFIFLYCILVYKKGN